MFASISRKAAAGTLALAAVGALMAPTAASAQAYTYQGDRYGYDYRYDQDRYRYDDRYDSRYDDSYRYRDNYDYCRSDRNQRRAAGATIGAGVGAVAGSQLAARGRRTEGSILGGVLGAVIGGSVGNDSARDCDRYYSQGSYSYEDRRYDDRYRYDTRSDDRYRYEDRYDDRRYGCRTESYQTRDYNGRLVTRYQEVCDGY